MSSYKYAIEVHNVKKRFSYSRHKNNSLKRAITQAFKKKDKTKDTFYALNGVSFNVEQGDFFGILGRNGSGKSTLLKIISEIYQPTSGSVKHHGKLVSFIELGVGFNPELSGRENVFLNAALLGFSKREIAAMYDDIVSFAELEKFMDQKLKNYSSGMKVRLAFSVAIRAKADILILDEVLAVGDAAFRKKCSNYFKTLKENHKTVILVTHSMKDVLDYCNKAIVIDEGKIIYEGESSGATEKYAQLFEQKTADSASADSDSYVVDIKHDLLYDGSRINIHLDVSATKNINDVIVGVSLWRLGGSEVFRWATDDEIVNKVINLESDKRVQVDLDIQNILPDGDYFVNMAVRSRDREKKYRAIPKAYRIRVRKGGVDAEYWKPECKYSITGA